VIVVHETTSELETYDLDHPVIYQGRKRQHVCVNTLSDQALTMSTLLNYDLLFNEIKGRYSLISFDFFGT
jgi:hypothetical protein